MTYWSSGQKNGLARQSLVPDQHPVPWRVSDSKVPSAACCVEMPSTTQRRGTGHTAGFLGAHLLGYCLLGLEPVGALRLDRGMTPALHGGIGGGWRGNAEAGEGVLEGRGRRGAQNGAEGSATAGSSPLEGPLQPCEMHWVRLAREHRAAAGDGRRAEVGGRGMGKMEREIAGPGTHTHGGAVRVRAPGSGFLPRQPQQQAAARPIR